MRDPSLANGTPSSNADNALNADDLELLHHYATVTYHTLADRRFWAMYQINFPQLGMEHHAVLHIILALSAAHLARMRPPRQEHYQRLGEMHSGPAFAGAYELLGDLSGSKAQATFASGVMIAFYVLARGPQLGDYLLFSDYGVPEWRPLVRGVRAVQETVRPRELYTGYLAPMATTAPFGDQQASAARDRRRRIDWEDALAELKQMLHSTLEGERLEVHMSAFENLEISYEAREGRREDESYQGGEHNQIVLIWIYRMQEEYAALLDVKEPIALLLLAYFCPLLQTEQRTIWMLEGWASHILSGVRSNLAVEWQRWLEWPAEQVRLQADMGTP